jgi:hypothetical protein
MSAPDPPSNPIQAKPGDVQHDVDPALLLPGRADLSRKRLEFQRSLIRSNRERFTPIQVSRNGVIIDGHHYVRAAAEEGRRVDVFVSPLPAVSKAGSILDLPLG